MLLDIEITDDQLIISYYNVEGRVEFKTYPTADLFNWQVCEPTDKRKDKTFINWDGRPVKKFKGKSINKHVIFNFLENLPKEDADAIFGYNFPKTYFFDIETEVTEGFPHAEKAENRVLTISILTPEKKVLVMGLRDLEKSDQADIIKKTNEYFKKFNANFELVFKKFDSEYDLLYTFMAMVKKFPMLTGWNCIGFDWKYLVNRCKRLQIDPSISSPSGKLDKKSTLPLHVGIIDYMDLYANWDRTITIKDNNKLETAAVAVIGVGKIKYDGNLQTLYDDDYIKYVYYNIVDSILVYYIDQKLKSMQNLLTLSNTCKISLYKAGSPVAITESLIARHLIADNRVMASKWDDDNKKDGQYAGAFVKPPIVGKHRAVACFDYASLYPSIMRQYNISPDSFIKKLPSTKIESFRKENVGVNIVTSSGAVYKTEQSILKTVLSDLYSKRKEYKKESFRYKMLVAKVSDKLKKM